MQKESVGGLFVLLFRSFCVLAKSGFAEVAPVSLIFKGEGGVSGEPVVVGD
jgi:hypothetical protein